MLEYSGDKAKMLKKQSSTWDATWVGHPAQASRTEEDVTAPPHQVLRKGSGEGARPGLDEALFVHGHMPDLCKSEPSSGSWSHLVKCNQRC